MAKVTKGILNYKVECDSRHAGELLELMISEGWEKVKSNEQFSPITSLWSTTIQKGDSKIKFSADDWFCEIKVPKKIWPEHEQRMSGIPR